MSIDRYRPWGDSSRPKIHPDLAEHLRLRYLDTQPKVVALPNSDLTHDLTNEQLRLLINHCQISREQIRGFRWQQGLED